MQLLRLLLGVSPSASIAGFTLAQGKIFAFSICTHYATDCGKKTIKTNGLHLVLKFKSG